MEDNKYQSTIKVEFRDLICHLLESDRQQFHLYTIHRILSLGLLIDFSFQYEKIPEHPDRMGILLDLRDEEVLFIVDVESNYIRIASDVDKQKLKRFITNFDTAPVKQSLRKRIF